MKNLLLYILGVIFFIILVGVLTQKSQAGKLQQKEIKIDNVPISVEIADTESLREKGLSGRRSLGENGGMLFIFNTKKIFPSFWMKDMLFSLDIIWITDGKVAKISKDVPAPPANTPDSQLALYYPDYPVDYVLEVNAGFSDKHSLKVGDAVNLSGI